MKPLRLANVTYLSALPFRHLSECRALLYEENTAIENARKLHEGEVDVALISATDFAVHGGYVGLDFGLGCRTKSESLMLYANAPLEDLKTIHLYESASSSAYLLRLLLIQKWGLSPRLLRRSERDLLRYVSGDEGVLVMHDPPVPLRGKFSVAIDLALAWHELTGKSYVSLVWAIRPGSLGRKEYRLLNELFHRCLKAREVIATQGALELNLPAELYSRYVTTIRQYYLDPGMLDGLEEFLKRAGGARILPECRYRSATMGLMGGPSVRQKTERGIQSIVASTLEGARLSVRDGVRLAREASLGDIALLADLLERKRESRSGIGKSVAEPEPSRVKVHWRWSVAGWSLEMVEELLSRLKERRGIWIQGLSAPLLVRLSRNAGVSLEECVARIVAAGLDLVESAGGGMLIDRLRILFPSSCSAAEWISTMKWVHRFGAQSRGELTVDATQTWEDRLLHLHKLRVLQDENPGIASVRCVVRPDEAAPLSEECLCRAALVGMIFLDNSRFLLPAEDDGLPSGDHPFRATLTEEGLEVEGSSGKFDEMVLMFAALRRFPGITLANPRDAVSVDPEEAPQVG